MHGRGRHHRRWVSRVSKAWGAKGGAQWERAFFEEGKKSHRQRIVWRTIIAAHPGGALTIVATAWAILSAGWSSRAVVGATSPKIGNSAAALLDSLRGISIALSFHLDQIRKTQQAQEREEGLSHFATTAPVRPNPGGCLCHLPELPNRGWARRKKNALIQRPRLDVGP